MVVANRSLAALELYTFPVPKSGTGPATMTKVAALGLPSVDIGSWISRLGFHNPPSKSIVTRMRQQLHDASIFAKPFISAPLDDIIFVVVHLCDERGIPDHISFVVHSSTLQNYKRFTPARWLTDPITILSSLSSLFISRADTIPWQMWGPTTTRWFRSAILPTRDVCGQRCLLQGLTSKEIWDFNQYRVRCLGQDFAMESEAACLSVVTEPSCVTSNGLRVEGGVYSSLPYVKLVLKQLKNTHYGTTCLDDDRIFCIVSPSHSSPLLFLF
jgi:hypothetical protein